MKFALIDGKKTEATKGAKGLCRLCGSEVVAKCGEVRVKHWAHKGKRACDRWWENETLWHRSWKEQFPEEWQEVIHVDEKGEKHIADVKTKNGWVLEFQHSYLKPEERRAREFFYNKYAKLVWVVDGLRRKTDLSQFKKIIEESPVVRKALEKKIFIKRVSHPEKCRLLKEWLNCSAPVFFDFKGPNLFLLFPMFLNVKAYLSLFSRNAFTKYYHEVER